MAAVSIRDSFNIKIFLLCILLTEISFAGSAEVDFYRLKQYSHTLRVSAAVDRLLSDPVFLEENPEYKPIARRAKSALRTALVHDKAKGLLTEYNVILANNYGVDYRSLPDSDPLKKQIQNAINQLNKRDDIFWKRAILRFSFFNDKKRKLLEQLVAAADYHDVPMSRAIEFGNGEIRKIDKASDWIPKMTHLPESQRAGMVRVAVFLEKNPDKFKDIYSEITPEKLAKNGTHTYMKALKSEAKTAQKIAKSMLSTKASVASKVLGTAGLLVTPAIVATHYIKDPVYSKPAEDFTEIITSSSELAKCQSLGCARLYKECKEKQLSEDNCLQYFLKKRLNEQTELRLNDDLNLILKAKAPLLSNLSCKKSGNTITQIKFSIVNYDNELQNQELNLDATEKIQSVNISPLEDEIRPADLIQFLDDEPSNLVLYQKPRVSKYSTEAADWSSLKIPKKDWEDKKMYFWTSGTAEQKSQIKRSQETLKIVRQQKSSLLKCCESNRCLSYFANLQNIRSENTRKQTVTVHHLK